MAQEREANIFISQSEDTPEVILSVKDKQIVISGPSFPEDAIEFYAKILDWLDAYGSKLDKLNIVFDYSILSSASNKMVYEIFLKLEKLNREYDLDVNVKWFYSSYDEDMYEEGLGFRRSVGLPIEVIEKTDV